jgi:hypothetical protein
MIIHLLHSPGINSFTIDFQIYCHKIPIQSKNKNYISNRIQLYRDAIQLVYFKKNNQVLIYCVKKYNCTNRKRKIKLLTNYNQNMQTLVCLKLE